MSKLETYMHGTNLSTADRASKLSPLHRYWDTPSTHENNRDVGVGFINPSDSSRNTSLTITCQALFVRVSAIKSGLMSTECNSPRINLLALILRKINPGRLLATPRLHLSLKIQEKISKLACKSSLPDLRRLATPSLERVAIRALREIRPI